ncbi:MAG: extracellular solute-binding protein [bacterium]|nr:extracellular solute-binding protein [bacterium]
MKKIVLGVLLLAVILGIIFWQMSLPRGGIKKGGPVTLTFWGMEEESSYRPVIEAYRQSHPNVQINYLQQSLLNYRTRVQTQLEGGQGPDVFLIHNSWLPMLIGDLAPAPSSAISMADYGKTFYPVAQESLTMKNKIYGMPLEIDGLAMYVNTDITQGVGEDVPKTWQQFIESSRKVTVKDTKGQIQTAGAALGTTTNVDFWPEIISLLFLEQPQGNLSAPNNRDGAEVIAFYTSFVTDPRNKTWDVNLRSSTEYFTQGKLAFYFAPSTKAQDIKSANPNLNFKVASVPQLPGRNISLGTFWAGAVSSRSENIPEAWDFLKYLGSQPAQQLFYEQRVQQGVLGRPFSRVDMAGLLAKDPILGVFVSQAPYYKSWYLNSTALDGGINEEMIKNYSGVIEAVLKGDDTQKALDEASQKIQTTLTTYNLK